MSKTLYFSIYRRKRRVESGRGYINNIKVERPTLDIHECVCVCMAGKGVGDGGRRAKKNIPDFGQPETMVSRQGLAYPCRILAAYAYNISTKLCLFI